MRTTLLLLCCLAVCARPANAQTDPDWLKKPYPLKVVLHVHPHPVLSEDFIRQLKLELNAGLRQHFGSVVEVRTVSSNESELMKEVLQGGWAVLDGKNNVSDEKEHLIQVRFNDGAYELEARQWDGFTGLCSALRTNRTADRSWVARQATLMVVQDFGVVAEVAEPLPKRKEDTAVKLRLKGWNISDRAQAMHLQRGEVFAFTRIKVDPDGKLRSERVPDALLVVTIYDDKGDDCSANWHARFTRMLPFAQDGRTKSFRALKLGTRQAPIKLRLVDKQTGNPVTGCKVAVQRGEGAERRKLQLRPDDASPGTYESTQPFAHSQGSRQPGYRHLGRSTGVAILTDDVIPLELTGTRAALRLAEFQYDYDQWSRPLNDVIDTITRKNPQSHNAIRSRKMEEALKLAEELEKTLDTDLTQLKENFKALEELANQAGAVTKPKIDEAKKLLAQLDQQLENYRSFIQEIKNPSPARAKFNKGQAAEDSYEFGQAIALYEESLKLDPAQESLKKRLDKMKRAWRIKNAKHTEARKFITTDWAKTDWQQLEDKLADSEKHVPALKEADDHLSAILLVNINQKHLKKLAEVQPNLGTSDADQEKGKMITKVREELSKMNTELLDFYQAAVQN